MTVATYHCRKSQSKGQASYADVSKTDRPCESDRYPSESALLIFQTAVTTVSAENDAGQSRVCPHWYACRSSSAQMQILQLPGVLSPLLPRASLLM